MNQNIYYLEKDKKHYPLPDICLKFDTFENDKITNIDEYNKLIEF